MIFLLSDPDDALAEDPDGLGRVVALDAEGLEGPAFEPVESAGFFFAGEADRAVLRAEVADVLDRLAGFSLSGRAPGLEVSANQRSTKSGRWDRSNRSCAFDRTGISG